jgi:predicted nucleotidyltransferase
MSQDINDKIVNYLKRFNPRRIGIFGSYARDEDTPQSDIDLLVDFPEQVTLFDMGGMKVELSEILNRPIEIVTERGLNNRIKEHIYRDLHIIFG